MERECGGVVQILVEEEMDMVVGVVDESEGRDTARFEPQITHHALWRGERELATGGKSLRHQRLLQATLEVVYVEVVVAMERYKIMAVALMIAEEEVFAVYAAVVAPPEFRLFYGFPLGMVIDFERYVV